MSEKWNTAITQIAPNRILVRGYRLDELIGRASFGQMVYLLIEGELPSPEVGRMMEAILVSSVDHGVTPPSTLAAITSASTGAPVNAALAAGILSINRHHGGAIENCMRLISRLLEAHAASGLAISEVAGKAVAESRAAKQRLPGLGHRLHTDDPRTRRLFELAGELNLAGPAVEALKALEAELAAASGKSLPINVDGAIAALLLDLGFNPALGNAFFIIARLPGLLAHVEEEYTRQKPMRVIDPREFEYDGPAQREVPGMGH